MAAEFPTDAMIGKYGQVIIDDYKVIRIYPPLHQLVGGPFSTAKRFSLSEKDPLSPPDRSLFMATGEDVITYSAVISGPGEAFEANIYYGQISGSSESGKGKIQTVTLADGSIEKTYPNGMIELIKTDGTILTTSPDGTKRTAGPDGIIIIESPNGIKTVKYPDGTSETTYPDGRVIKVLPDGTVINSSAENEGAELRLSKLMLQARRDTDGLSDVDEDNGAFTNLKSDNNSDRIARKIDVGMMVASLSGWGIYSSNKSDNERLIDRNSFRKLDRKNRLRKFIKWSNGELENKAGKELSFLKKKDLN